MNAAFRASFNEGIKIKHRSAYPCYFCSNYYGRKDKFDRHFENCTGRPGYVYNCYTQSLLKFEENLKYKGDISLVAYINFEATAPTAESLDPENRFTVTDLCWSLYFIKLQALRPTTLLKRDSNTGVFL